MDGKKGTLAILLVLLVQGTGYTQVLSSRFKISGSAEVVAYDSRLDFEPGPSFGLGAGYRITELLRLNLALSYSPAKQQIPTAISTVTADFSVYALDFGIGLKKRAPIFWRLYPLLEAGVGMFVINPHKFELTQFEAPTGYRPSAYFQGGIAVKVSRRLQLGLSYRHRFLSIRVEDAVSQNKITAQNKSVKLTFATFL